MTAALLVAAFLASLALMGFATMRLALAAFDRNSKVAANWHIVTLVIVGAWGFVIGLRW